MSRPGFRKLSLILVTVGVSALLSLAGIEAVLRTVHAHKKELRRSVLGGLESFMRSPYHWEQRFVSRFKKGMLVYQGLHEPHPTRGWALKPHLAVERTSPKGGLVTYTTNRHGARSLFGFVEDPDRYQVIIVGDSFTFGDGIDDSVTWPHVLQQQDERLQVFNMAVTGYGVDQMYLRLTEAAEEFSPQLVIVAYVSDNLRRSLLNFRDYKKPRFVLEDGELVLTNVPIGGIEEVYEEARQKARLQQEKLYSDFLTVNVVRSLLRRLGSEDEREALNRKLFEEMQAIAAREQADFVMAYLPHGDMILDLDLQDIGESFLDGYQSEHGGNFLNPRAELVQAEFPKASFHYAAAENELIGALVYRKIQQLPSWKKFLEKSAGRSSRSGGAVDISPEAASESPGP